MRWTEQVVTRWRLIDALEQAPAGSVVLLTAAAGYGKSTLLRQWAASSSRASVIVQASVDQDAELLGVAIVEALAAVLPAAAPLLERAQRVDVDWACDLVPYLFELASTHAIGLAIDDAHVLATPSSRELISVLAASWPGPSVLILSGRERPPVPLVRDRLAAPVVSLGERDLDFDDEELDQVREASGLAADRSELMELTGAWPAGIRLAALLRDADLHGDRISVEEYLTDHVLGAFSEHELDYLGHIATLAPAPARTIDLILRRNDTLTTLESLAARGLPMVQVPISPDRDIVVHALLAQVLADRLERRTQGSTGALVDLAVESCERAHEYSYAFNLLDRRGRTDRLRSMPYLYMFPLVSTGRTRELRSWMEQFDADELVRDPFLVFPHSNVSRPRDEQQVRSLFRLHETDTETILPDGITPALACRRMLTAFGLSPADPADTGVLGGWRQTHGVTLAWDLYSDDRIGEAEAALLELRNSAHKYPVTNAVGLAKLAIIALETGRPDRAAEQAAEASRIVADGRMEETALGFIVDAVNLKLARRAGALDEAERIATGARRKMAVVGDGTMLERVTTLVEIAGLYVDLELPAAMVQALLDEATEILGRWPSTLRLDRQLAQVQERLEAVAPDQAPTVGGSELITTAELRVLRYLPSHLTIPRIADELHVAPSTVKSQCQAIYRKLDVGSRADAVLAATHLGLLA